MTTIHDFLKLHCNISPNADILQRWEARVVAGGLHERGRSGVCAYIARFGKGMKSPKALMFGKLAELKGFPEFAAGFYEEAFFLETGIRVRLDAKDTTVASAGEVAPRSPAMKKFLAGLIPQLLTVVTWVEVQDFIDNRLYCIQEKFDGERVLARIAAGIVAAGNKKGFERGLPLNVSDALATLLAAEVDGELVADVYYVFDLLSVGGVDLRSTPYSVCYAKLEALLQTCILGKHSAAVKIVKMVTGAAAKAAFVAALEHDGAEGFVMKEMTAPYEAGESHKRQWKYQFRCTAPAIAGKPNGSIRSVEFFVHRASGELRSLGFVPIPANQPIPREGEIAEIQCLWLHPGPDGCFCQGAFKGVRTDSDESECLEIKFRVKPVAV